jgi:GAF domain-containing protein/HAMP domain-containing protein
MTATDSTPVPEVKQKRFKGSLAGTLLRTLLILTFIPLVLMAGTAYFRMRALLQEQTVAQSQSLLTAQFKIIDERVSNKEAHLEQLLKSSDFTILMELALHANPQSSEFLEIRNGILKEFKNLNAQEDTPKFDQFLLVDPNGVIKIASDPKWQGATLDPSIFNRSLNERPSTTLYGLSPIYKDELILFTALPYKTDRGSTLGTIVGITEKANLKELIQPLYGLSPLAKTYFVLSDQQYIYNESNTGNFIPAESAASQSEINTILTDLMTKETPQPKSVAITTPNGEAVLAQIEWFPRIQSGVVMELNAGNTRGQIANLLPFTLILILGTVLVTGLVLQIGINRVIKPLRSLSDIAHGFANGNWSLRAEVHDNDEIGVLANSFNKMADELGGTHQSLEQKADERNHHIRITGEAAQNITTLSSLDELLENTVELLVRQFSFYQASIFIVDQSRKYLEFKTGFGAAAGELAKTKYRLEVNSQSMIGWVSANNQSRVAPDALADPLYLAHELLPETRSEACTPISIGNFVLGVLDVQRSQAGPYSPETIVLLKTLCNQIATVIQTNGLMERSQGNFEELARLYRSNRLIAKAHTENEILEIGSRVLKETPYAVTFLKINNNKLEVFSSSDSTGVVTSENLILQEIGEANIEVIDNYLHNGEVIATSNSKDIPNALLEIMQKLEIDNAVFIPIRKSGVLAAILILGSGNQILSHTLVQPYTNFADLMSITMEKTNAILQTEKHLHEMEGLAMINEAVATSSNMQGFFKNLLDRIQQIFGDYNMIVALYDEKNNTINIPFNYEDQKITVSEPFPLGEGLISILIRSCQPLMLVDDTEHKAAELGVKFTGKPARSWMGAPMLVQNKPIGALILQDNNNEHAFNEDDLKFLISIAGQVAGMIHNSHLLDESLQRAIQLETAAEIARDISGSLNLDELLIKAVNFIHERFYFYHASIFLHDLPGEFAVIREATGEAGAQMKRAGYKIGVGSKSIVGYVSSQGHQLVVGDTTKDATYYANPLFPETRAEAALPLKVGERILGVLDVQSATPYAFTEDKLRSLQILADQLAIAVVNTELFAETQEHLSQHRLLHHITTTAASGTTLEEALENAVSGLQVTLGGDRVMILLVNRENNTLEVKASIGYSENISKVQVAIGSGITGWAAAHKRALRVRDVTQDPRYMEISTNTLSELAIPLIYRNELLGVLNVESELIDAYTENDEEMLGTLGGSLAAIIANARLVEQIRIQAERERMIYEVTSKIRRSTDIQSILNTTASELIRLTGAQYTKIQIKSEMNTEREDR